MDRVGKFAGENPFEIAKDWMNQAKEQELNDANAIALATVDSNGLPNVRMVLLKEIEENAFVFYTNYESKKGRELIASGQAAFVIHWKSLRRQIRVRGSVEKAQGKQADAYFDSRSPQSRVGAIASRQSQVINDRSVLEGWYEEALAANGTTPSRPSFWGGFRINPTEIEFWADGEARLHDRFRWTRDTNQNNWSIDRLSP
ncbi:pyridoxamine 5'-phosphate oxidase [Amylibacter sp.]|nr:pyridoxamine 5'-phosphate oxidase [Amylibacter sp.]